MYYVITIIDISAGIAALYSLICVAKNYHLSDKMEIYIFLTIASMVYLVFANLYNLFIPSTEWKVKLLSLIWASKTLYFTYAVRFMSIRKGNKKATG